MYCISQLTRTSARLLRNAALRRASRHGTPARGTRRPLLGSFRYGLLLSLLGGVGLAPLWSQQAYVANEGSNTVSVIDTGTNTVEATVAVENVPYAVAITPDGTRAYVMNYNSGTVSVINTSTNTVGTTVAVGSGPYGVAITPDGTRAYVTIGASNNVSVINTSTNTVEATVAVGNHPIAVAITPLCPAPVITGASVDKPVLWPPQHQMVPVTVSYTHLDTCSASTCTLAVSSNEPGPNQWQVLDNQQVLLRAERNGNGPGRVYTITITCTNASQQVATQSVTVRVPHDQGQ